MAEKSLGRLAVVGSGMQLGRDITSRAQSTIEQSDAVFAAVDEFTLVWLRTIRPDVVSLARHYADGRDRRETYLRMEADLVGAVEAGKDVCAVFYGHPGVFADVPHSAIRKLRERGFQATMDPGISSEACLYADLGIDPGAYGVQGHEATQFLIYERVVDPSAALILWQIGLVGDLTCTQFSTTPERLQALVNKLARTHSLDSPAIVYEAAMLPLLSPRTEQIKLRQLPEVVLKEYSTLYIPPNQSLNPDVESLNALGISPKNL